MIMHVYPDNDEKEHVTDGTQCHCNPAIRLESGNMIVVHNSYDGREYAERAEVIFNNPENYL